MAGFGILETRLYDAAATGNLAELIQLHQEDPLLLDRVSFTCPNKTPLHIAAMQNNQAVRLVFVQQILAYNSQLAELVDLQHKSPLHIAAATGYLDIVTALLVAPDVCLYRDYQGRNPLHLTAIKGHARVLRVLIGLAPVAAREKVDQGQTVLHLCVKHHKLAALRASVPSLGDIINAKDDNGNTALHLAAMNRQREPTIDLHKITYSELEANGIDVNATNSIGQTARDILDDNTRPEKWLSEKRDTIMVVAILIATMAFQSGLNPPGGVWQDNLTLDSQGHPVPNPHRAGEAIMAYRKGTAFFGFVHSNTAAFISSLTTILLLISGLPFGRNRYFLYFLMVIMWVNVTSIVIAYAIGMNVVSPREDTSYVRHVEVVGLILWGVVMVILFIGNTIRFTKKWLNRMV